MEILDLAKGAEDFTGNIWLIKGNTEIILVDVGTGDSWDRIKELECVDKVIVTHSHYDHVDNLEKVVEKFGPKIFAFEPNNLDVSAETLADGQEIVLDTEKYMVIHTPGHRDDSICLYGISSKVLFTGDLIFPEAGFGRTDLEQGDRSMLIQSIEKIVDLDVEAFYPGHGEAVVENANKWIEKSLQEAKKHEPKY